MGRKSEKPVKEVASQEAESDDEVPDLEMAAESLAQFLEPTPEEQLEIDLLQRDINAVELNQIRATVPLYRPLYERRSKLIESKLAAHSFWPRAIGNASRSLLDAIMVKDLDILNVLLRSFHVERISVDSEGKRGDPRDLKFVFEFGRDDEENEWFAGDADKPLRLEKTFYWRKQISHTSSGQRRLWEGLVSEPVRIPWKKDADPTNGLLDAACDLYEAEQQLAKRQGSRIGGADRTALPQYETLVQKLEIMKTEVDGAEDTTADDDEAEPVRFSFFTWFGYRGRDVTAEESAAAEKEDAERWDKLKKGDLSDEGEHSTGGPRKDEDEDAESDVDEDDGDEGLDDAEICPDGEEIALELADDLWPKALQYFNESFEMDDDDDDDLAAMLRSGEGDDDDDDEDDEEWDGIEEVEAETQPPKKKAKRAA
ncbi:hypothetical protein KEM52_005542 [Ascosphaera acerosa]|nr:hypothetical protein KEM52_005542 [Ascosphaera acerosa]